VRPASAFGFRSSEEMKSCPACNRIYADETLTYCLEDGAALSAPYEPEQTQRLPPPRATTPATEVLPAGPPAARPARGRNPVPVYVAIGIAALLSGGALVAWMKSGSNASPTAESKVSNSAPSPGGAGDSLEEEKARLERERQQLALEKERQQLAEERRELEDQKRGAATPTTPQAARQLPQPSGGSWFVFLGSFPKSEYGKANERLQQIKGLGYDASIIDSDEYPNLRGGLWAVVMGPYSRSDAQNQAARMKSIRPDAYIKSGW
jgi:hypothetical protein